MRENPNFNLNSDKETFHVTFSSILAGKAVNRKCKYGASNQFAR